MVALVLDDSAELVKKISDKTGLDEKEIHSRIEKRREEYGGLLTQAGAAFSIARELGIKTALKESAPNDQKSSPNKKLSELRSGDLVNVAVRVQRIFPKRFFERDGKQGKLASIIISDGTVSRRLVLWDEQTDLVEKMREDQTILVQGALVKENRGELELQLRQGKIEFETTIPVPEIFQKANIKDLNAGEVGRKISAKITAVYLPIVFEACANCGGTMQKDTCSSCGSKNKANFLIINAEVEDGTGKIRTSFYRKPAERLLEMTGNEFKSNQELFEQKREKLTGLRVTLIGDVRKIEKIGRNDFIVRNFEKIE